MRLIDLDEFLRQNCVDRMDGKTCDECKHHVLAVSCERLMEQPTIDPVKHGKWEMLMGWPFPEWRCSQCGNHICGDKEHLKKWNYCPNCGAYMQEGEDDE